MSDTLLFEKIDQLVDDCADARGDWDDVLRRSRIAAEPAPAGPRPRRFANRRALVWAFALATLLVILFATPAFGLLRDWIGRKDVPFNGKTAPFVIKREFADQSIGVPKNWDPQAIAAQSREVAVFRLFGKKEVVYVAPTRTGGFCVAFGKMGEMGQSCARSRTAARTLKNYVVKLRPGSVNPQLLSVSSGGYRVSIHSARWNSWLSGVVFAKNATSLRVEYEDRTSAQIPFVYVSKPIDSGFFLWARPPGRSRVGKRPATVSARDSQGTLVARVSLLHDDYTYVRRPSKTGSTVPSKHRRRRPLVPTPPLQRGQAGGVRFVAGRNGVLSIDTSHASARVRALIGTNAYWTCFSFFAPYHEIEPAGIGLSLPAGRSHATWSSQGIPKPFDGCVLVGTYDFRWPDRLHSHHLVEVAFTAHAKRYFADRAAALDLAGFVRSDRTREIRRLSGKALDAAISRDFRTLVTHLPSSTSSLPPEQIGYFDSAGGATFIEYSTTGRRFYVTLKKGKTVSENVRELERS
jgi:hypothetical protein